MCRKRQLHEDSIDFRGGVEAFYQIHQLLLRRALQKLIGLGFNPDIGARLFLVVYIYRRSRILPYLNVSVPGIFAFSKTVMVGENCDMRLIDPREAVRVARMVLRIPPPDARISI